MGQSTSCWSGAKQPEESPPEVTSKGNVDSTPVEVQAVPESSKPAPAAAPRREDMITAALSQVGTLIQQLAELRLTTPSAPPAQFLKRTLKLVAADSVAVYVSVHVLSPSLDYALMVAALGPTANAQLHVPGPAVGLLAVGEGSGTSVERLLSSNLACFTWRSDTDLTDDDLPSDWRSLVSTNTDKGTQLISCVPVRLGPKLLGVLTVATSSTAVANVTSAGAAAAAATLSGVDVWPTYLNLVSSGLCSTISDERLQVYLTLVRNVSTLTEIGVVVQQILSAIREILGTQRDSSVWYRLAFCPSKTANAVVLDDLTQVPKQLAFQSDDVKSDMLMKRVRATNGIIHTSIDVKSSVMLVAMNRRHQVVVPDVQKLINQSGMVCSDIFTTRLIKPPTSVLVVPFLHRDEVFGAVYCMSAVPTDFEAITPALKELCSAAAPHIHKALNGHLEPSWERMKLDVPNNPPVSGSEVPLEEGATRDSFSDGSDAVINGGGHDSGANNAAAAVNRKLKLLSQESVDSRSEAGDVESMYAQSRSATGALVTGLTEKLAHRRIKSTMNIAQDHGLVDLRLHSILGEGAFGKVFQGVWQGLTVGVKIVCDDGTIGRAIMKNAHEIAILSAISHPSIIQAYQCLTDVSVRELVEMCFKDSPDVLLASTAYKYLVGQARQSRECHLQIIEFCDRGNLASAIHEGIFLLPITLTPSSGNGIGRSSPSHYAATSQPGGGGPGAGRGARINFQSVIATLLEVANGLAHLHRMGVVHCDLKPSNILLKSSVSDKRGFTAKLTDFGLSRIQDSDGIASFPYNSCGTAAYVAPEALNGLKRVNPSVDVYSFGVMLWELYTGKKPYDGMKAQHVVMQVAINNMRPLFPPGTPDRYARLAKACWATHRDERPTFEAVVTELNSMLAEFSLPAGPQ